MFKSPFDTDPAMNAIRKAQEAPAARHLMDLRKYSDDQERGEDGRFGSGGGGGGSNSDPSGHGSGNGKTEIQAFGEIGEAEQTAQVAARTAAAKEDLKLSVAQQSAIIAAADKANAKELAQVTRTGRSDPKLQAAATEARGRSIGLLNALQATNPARLAQVRAHYANRRR